jgi:hypothetical protein|tara:strand:+ start:8414 stop:8608 length:195 start_codon:yes stop_codon:yes gene_type:complete
MNDVETLEAIEKEIDKRIVGGGKVHNEDLVHFLMADYTMTEKIAKEYVDLYTSYFTELVEEDDD